MKAFEKHIADFYHSDAFKQKAEDAVPFFEGIKDFVFGRPTILENMVSLGSPAIFDVLVLINFVLYSGM